MSDHRRFREFFRRQLERSYARRYGWDAQYLNGKKLVDDVLKLPHRIDGPLAAMLLPRKPIHRLFIERFGYFGNAVAQLKHVGFICELTGAHILQAHDPGQRFLPEIEQGLVLADRTAPTGEGEEVTMRGIFYYAEALSISLQPEDHVRLVKKFVRPILRPSFLEQDPRISPDDMIMHFRSGDIMRGEHINGGYGQPPVSFYIKAAALSGARRFWLIYQDDANPAVALVEKHLKREGFTVFKQSSSLENDCRVILSASQFACAYGTFGLALAEISTNLRNLYTFSEFDRYPLEVFKATQVKVTRIEDGEGIYTRACMSSNWQASTVQLGLLRSYPIEWLVVSHEDSCSGR